VFLRDGAPLEAVAKRLEPAPRSPHANGDGEVSVQAPSRPCPAWCRSRRCSFPSRACPRGRCWGSMASARA
jgi:hypothetical protein